MARATPSETRQHLRMAAGAAAAALPPLLVAARRIAATVALGSHGRRRAGPGESFWQFRPYARDDTPQSIDWRQSGKFDVVYVREREWIAAQTVALWCDLSPSMHYRSRRSLPTKAERAAVIVVALAELLVDGGERIIIVSPDGRPSPAATGRIAVAQAADLISKDLVTSGTRTRETPSVDRTNNIKTILPRHTAAVLISDFLSPLDDIAAQVRSLAAQGAVGHLLQVLDPAEETLPFRGRIRFVGLEHEGATVVERAENARAAYIERLAAHRAGVKDIAARAGWTFAVHHTDRSPQAALSALHQTLTNYGR